MTDLLSIPADLTPDEARAVATFVARTVERAAERAAERAEQDAALWLRVRRAWEAYRARGLSKDAALDRIEETLPVTRATARRIVYREGRWAIA